MRSGSTGTGSAPARPRRRPRAARSARAQPDMRARTIPSRSQILITGRSISPMAGCSRAARLTSGLKGMLRRDHWNSPSRPHPWRSARSAASDTATIDWGDGSSTAGTITSLGGGQYSVSGSHTYADEGTPTVAVSINDPDDPGGPATVRAAATVTDAALAASGSPDFVSTNPVSGTLATFTDANPGATVSDFTAGGGSTTIDWGDGNTGAGTVTTTGPGQFTVGGTHTYAALGPYTITISITDDGGSTATAKTHVIVFAFSSGGSFVIGNTKRATGTAVTFWGSQWAQNNPLAGGPAPSSFKGFEDGAARPACDTRWNTDPGNSTPPPAAPLPSYMGVIVSTSIAQNGSVISGDTPHIVVVKTNPGYQPDPSHAGTGTVVAQVC